MQNLNRVELIGTVTGGLNRLIAKSGSELISFSVSVKRPEPLMGEDSFYVTHWAMDDRTVPQLWNGCHVHVNGSLRRGSMVVDDEVLHMHIVADAITLLENEKGDMEG